MGYFNEKDSNMEGPKALYISIMADCSCKKAYGRLEGKGLSNIAYNPLLSIRKNAKKMGVSTATVQKLKKYYFLNGTTRQMTLFDFEQEERKEQYDKKSKREVIE